MKIFSHTSSVALLVLFVSDPGALSCQDSLALRNERYLIWQPDVEIKFADYVMVPDTKSLRLSQQLGIGTISVMELLRVVDVPKRKRARKTRPEVIYIAPAFCRKCSSVLWNDPVGVMHDQWLFDATEMAARVARADMDSLRILFNADNTGLMWLETVVKKADEFRWRMYNTYFKEVVLTHSDSAYVSWRSVMDEMLSKTGGRATRIVDCQRFVLNEPLIEGYTKPKYRSGDLFPDKRTP